MGQSSSPVAMTRFPGGAVVGVAASAAGDLVAVVMAVALVLAAVAILEAAAPQGAGKAWPPRSPPCCSAHGGYSSIAAWMPVISAHSYRPRPWIG
ncbi:hypothetical protein BN873_590005 [Candidatus Competibacter denitrificans Run_A_D11]|uniref:Uncharacterized protein n=1 Tax=Candidatus Competibacter denitrificans Run_A_D11 TaxID=1400863 RepID=W6MBM2_9GAMM|nr:hypothetical protein BN873_590005 [Candidatus Competibacter denitrificans Run_A_D11]